MIKYPLKQRILKSSLSLGPPGQEEREHIPPAEMREMLRWLPRSQSEICSIVSFAAGDVLTRRGALRIVGFLTLF